MTNRERVIAAIRHEQPDRTPHYASFTKQMLEKIIEHTGNPDYLSTVGNHIDKASLKKPLVPLPGAKERFTDEFGIEWDLSGADKDIGFVAEHPLKTADDLYSYEPPEPDESFLRETCEKLVKNRGENFTAASVGFTIFERSWSLCGMEDLLCYMLTDPDAVEALFDKLLAYNLIKVKIALESGADMILFGDDWGRQRGLIMGAPLWRKLIKPRVAALYAEAIKNGAFVGQHSCGDNSEILDDLVEIGLDVYQTFQPEIYDIGAYKEKYAGKLAFWGGVGTQSVLPFGSPEEVYNVTRQTVALLGRGGGYIASPTHDMPGDIPPDNVEAMIRAFKS